VLEEHNSLSRWAFERYRAQAHPIGRLRGWVNWRKRLRYESRLYRCFDLCTMVSELDREATVRLLPHRSCCVVVVPNGIDCQHNRPSMSRSQANTLVFNGSLTYSANYDAMQMFLSQIYPRIRIEVPDVTLTITGSSCGVDLAGLCLDESVHLSGHVDDVRPLVAGAQACVVPLRQGGGTRLKILEAMALGTPVIATSKGAEGLEVVDGTHLLLADEPLDFSQRVVQILQEPALSEFLATNARRLVERHYDWEQIGQRFVALVEAAGACRDP
jgi:glycosyltransferase involved in cell wall biosynthesis